MTNDPTNLDRAAWAKRALTVFTGRTFGGDHPDTMHAEDVYDATCDLFADLLHLARQRGFDPAEVAERAVERFNGVEFVEGLRR